MKMLIAAAAFLAHHTLRLNFHDRRVAITG
jgi:hypothetical protein